MKQTKLRLVILGFFAVSLAVLIGVLLLLPNLQKPKSAYAEPHIYITPTPGMEEQEEIIVQTPLPTAIRRTPPPALPQGAVNLLSDGVALFALDSRESAELLVKTYYQQCANEGVEENCILLKATLVSSLSTVPADGTVDYLSFEEALNKLNKNRSLISVQRTVERVKIEEEDVETVTEQSALLPEGTRLIRRIGTPKRTLVLSETIYKDGYASADVETLRRQITTGSSRSVVVGTYRSAQPDREPSQTEGVMGKPAGALSFVEPVRGTKTAFFGTRYGVMHYGVDYTAAAGSRIVAPESGTVIFCGERAGYGFVIEIRHENGFVSRLASCDRAAVELFEHVARGAVVAYLPAEEGAKSAVLHYELHIDGIPYNPLYYLP